MYFMDEGKYSDWELGPFFYSVINKLQEGKYKEDSLNKNSPAGKASEPLAGGKTFFIIENYGILKMHVSELKEELNI